MEPKFTMISDSIDPLIKTCTGYWSFPDEDKIISQRFEDGESCMRMNAFIQETYDKGFKEGKIKAAFLVNRAIKDIVS